MIMHSEQLAVADLKAGDIIKRHGRTVVVTSAETETVTYGAQAHTVTLVKGIEVDAGTQRPVQWLAVPDQLLAVIR